MRNLLQHLEKVRFVCEALDCKRSLIFCAACCERQLFAYRKSLSSNYLKIEISERILSDAWNGVVDPETELEVSDADFSASDSTENFLYSINVLLKCNETNFAQSCRSISEFGLNIVDALAYEILELPVNGKNDIIVDAHDLIKVEIGRQNSDMEFLLNNTSLHGLKEFRRTLSKQDITLGFWYT
jgi:hypothetical protein